MADVSSSSSSSSPDCRYGIELTKEISKYEVTGRPQAWRMRVYVSKYYGLNPNIFVYLRRPATSESGEYRDTFEAVASPVDLEEYPVAVPEPVPAPQFFRLSDIDLLARNITLLDETWEAIQNDRDELIRTLSKICELKLDEVSAYGYFPT